MNYENFYTCNLKFVAHFFCTVKHIDWDFSVQRFFEESIETEIWTKVTDDASTQNSKRILKKSSTIFVD